VHVFSDPWHTIEFAVLILAALIIAIKEYGKDMPNAITTGVPYWLKSRHWGAIPLILVALFILIATMDYFNALPFRSQLTATPGGNDTPVVDVRPLATNPKDDRSPLIATPGGKGAPVVEVRPPTTNPKDDRIFINRDPKEIHGMLKGKMRREQSLIMAPFIGKWMNLSVIVEDISIRQGYYGTLYAGFSMGDTNMIFNFKQKWVPYLETLSKGQRVNVIGKIDEIASFAITLEECELN
jgi:hypothetical protein